MGLKHINIPINKISKESTLRLDFNFLNFSQKVNTRFYKFKDLFDLVTFDKSERLRLISNLEGENFFYSEIGNISREGEVEPVTLNFDNRDMINEDYFKKIEKGDIQKAEKGNILISKIRPKNKKNVLIDKKTSDIFYTTAFMQLKPKKLGKILFNCLMTFLNPDLLAISRCGKGYPSLKEEDLMSLKLNADLIDYLEENEVKILNEIEPFEENIKKHRSKFKEPKDIINDVFNKELGFNLKEFKTLKNKKENIINKRIFSNNLDLRCGARFHRKSGKFVADELRKITKKKIKHFISEPIILGKTISPKDFDENGEYFYLSMETIKNWKFEKENAKLVSEEYANINLHRSVRIDDIIATRSGEAIGKFAIINKRIKAIFADFTMRIRLKNYNPLFAYYWFNTHYFQYLIEINKKGKQNFNIFPNQIKEFPLLDIPLDKQERFVRIIKPQIEEQEIIHGKVYKEKKKIKKTLFREIQNFL